jgi:prepilin-type N-terminal cleavage/methylation domain-containing protein
MMEPLHPKRPELRPCGGFTLLEVLIVLFILGMIAAMAVPAMGILDDRERERITRDRMEAIRRAILGPDDRFDEQGRPVVGGYVGDMGAWPDLWEPRAEVKPEYETAAWDDPASLPSGIGQGPDYEMDPVRVFFRPSGHFVKDRWQWHRPYRKLYDDTANHYDHIGGLETENEGQPRGLWTRFPEELPFDIGTHAVPGEDLGDDWMGPYIAPPVAENPSDSGHLARNDEEYDRLVPVPEATLDPINKVWLPSWEDGDYRPSGGPGEHFDDREAFRMLQTEGRLTDGWGRPFRFFITADPDHAGGTIFWILSEGPDKEGTYPTKGTCGGHAWTVDADDTMSTVYDESDPDPKGYNENDPYNRDNIVVKLYSRDWEALLAAAEEDKTAETEATLERIREALIGESPAGQNTGFTGDLTRWPGLFRWEDGTWDDKNDDATPVPYTKGQPRELWTDTPNAADSDDDLAASLWGLGWRHAYIGAPAGSGADNLLTDAWDREILFFKDDGNDLLLVLSRGPDGKFDFGATNADNTEPEDFVEEVIATAYDPSAQFNADNRHIVVAGADWRPGFFRLLEFTVLNATSGTTKACFFRADGAPVAGVDLLEAGTHGTLDAANTWTCGDDADPPPAFDYDDTTAEEAVTGARYLVFWNDADGNDEIDSGEEYYRVVYNVTAKAGSGQHEAITVDTDDFVAYDPGGE